MTPLTVFRAVRRLVAGLVLAVLVVVGGTAVRVWQVARQDHRPRSDAIVVMGASQFDGRPSEILKARLDHAKTLYDERVAPRIVTVGGGQPGDRTTEAATGVRYLEGRGIPASALLAVPTGNDTLQSAEAVATTYAGRKWHSAVLVTDPWHELRSRRMLQDLGVRTAASPVRTGPAVHTRSTELRYIARETGAYLYYRAFHRSSRKGPNAV